MARKQKLQAVIEDGPEVTKRDGTKLYGKAGTRYAQGILETIRDEDLFLITDKEAPEGHLSWLDGADDPMPEAACINYDMTADCFGRVYPAMALRNAEGDLLAAAKMKADDMVDLGKWCFKTAFFKLGLVQSGHGGKGTLQDAATAKAVLVDQVNDILDHLIQMAPDIVAERVSAAGKAVLSEKMATPIREHCLKEAGVYVQRERIKHAEQILTLAKIAARRKRDAREEALSDPAIERMIVDAKETIDAHSAGAEPAVITRKV